MVHRQHLPHFLLSCSSPAPALSLFPKNQHTQQSRISNWSYCIINSLLPILTALCVPQVFIRSPQLKRDRVGRQSTFPWWQLTSSSKFVVARLLSQQSQTVPITFNISVFRSLVRYSINVEKSKGLAYFIAYYLVIAIMQLVWISGITQGLVITLENTVSFSLGGLSASTKIKMVSKELYFRFFTLKALR